MIAFKPPSYRLAILLALLAGVVVWINAMPTAEPNGTAVIEATSTQMVEDIPSRQLDPEPLSQRTLPKFDSGLFGVPATAAVMSAPILSPPTPTRPELPPLPYTYLGQYRDADGLQVFYLRRGDEVILAKAGATLDESFRLEPDTRHGLLFTHLGTKLTHTIPIESAAP